MDKFDFINRIIALYPHAITDKQAQYDTYARALNNNTDFEQLLDIYATEYKDGFPPPAAVLKEMAARCIKEEIVSAQKWLHVKIKTPSGNIRNTDCFPSGTTKDQIIKTYEKMFNCTGWQVIEVN